MKLLLSLVALTVVLGVRGHGDHSQSKTECRGPASSLTVISAEYIPGLLTLDGDSSDWDIVEGDDFPLYPALDPMSSDPYPDGKMTIKVAHDGRDLFFLVKVPGTLQYKQDVHHGNPSVALMFPVGDDATYTDMGGCSESLNCTKANCGGHEVDIMLFSVTGAVPGRIYGGNLADNLNGTGKDSLKILHDLYAWNPHCRYFDGYGPAGYEGGAQNDWKGVWSHTSIDNKYGLTAEDSPYGSPGRGSFIFEFSRPLRTSDRLQQDAQFSIGKNHKFATALWFPKNNVPWNPTDHYSANCDWIPLRILAASQNERAESAVVATSLSIFSLFIAAGSMIASAVVAWWTKTNKQVPFTPLSGINNL